MEQQQDLLTSAEWQALGRPLNGIEKDAVDFAGSVMGDPRGWPHIDQAATYLGQQLSSGRFNTERAIEVFSMAFDNAVWATYADNDEMVKQQAYSIYKASAVRPHIGRLLAEKFVRQTGASDQRKPRRWLRSVFGA